MIPCGKNKATFQVFDAVDITDPVAAGAFGCRRRFFGYRGQEVLTESRHARFSSETVS